MHFRKLVAFLCLFATLLVIAQPAAAASASDEATGLYNLAELKLNQNDTDQAILYFDKALAANTTMMAKAGTLIYIYSDKSAALIQKERYADAITTAEQGLAIDSTYPRLWNNKGYALYKLGKYQEAITAYDKAISHATTINNESLPKYYINKGDALYDLGKFQDAAVAYSKALTVDPGNPMASEKLALAQEKAGSSSQVFVIGAVAVIVIGAVAAYFLHRKKNGKPEKKKSGK